MRKNNITAEIIRVENDLKHFRAEYITIIIIGSIYKNN